jgi:hypothetical protein
MDDFYGYVTDKQENWNLSFFDINEFYELFNVF